MYILKKNILMDMLFIFHEYMYDSKIMYNYDKS